MFFTEHRVGVRNRERKLSITSPHHGNRREEESVGFRLPHVGCLEHLEAVPIGVMTEDGSLAPVMMAAMVKAKEFLIYSRWLFTPGPAML
ncbi:hypothetical protein AAFF_G00381160 [Aldrovandia affinis]|uniref:Uncharacterized protein n=1 Tax=Aldrovandia affinis TaxID=143900 RepID=A0AAD7T7Z8_9TELE|nr:hypothetical protein AAFF_G00381160 [Aldrovandia affinis]